jgi:hypothetical protein
MTLKKVRQIIANSTTGTGNPIIKSKGSDIAKVLDQLSTEFGYDKLNDEEKRARISFLRREFPDIALENVVDIVSGVISGRIAAGPGPDHKFTKKLSPEWFSCMFIAFRLYWAERQRKTNIQTPKNESKSPGSTDEEFYNGLRDIVEAEGSLPLGWNFAAVRRHLTAIGKLNVTPEQIKDIGERISKSVLNSAATIRDARAARIKISEKNFSDSAAADRMIIELHFKDKLNEPKK